MRNPLWVPLKKSPSDNSLGVLTGSLYFYFSRMTDVDFLAAMTADTNEEAILHLNLPLLSIEELEDLAWCFAYMNSSTKKAPSDRESACASACLERIELLEKTND